MATTAFVLSGGGSLGAVQVGMLQALAARRIQPDLLIGTSAGALNAAFVAGGGTSPNALNELGALWGGMRRRDVFPLQPGRLSAAAVGRARSLCSPQPLRRLVDAHTTYDRVEDASIPLHLVATDATSGTEVLLSRGDIVDAVAASAALPAVFPAVHIGGADLFDGGIANNAAISQAIELGADTIYVLPTGYACALRHAPVSAVASALHALTLLIEQRLILDVARFAPVADIRVIPPLCPLNVTSVDFRYGTVLIERARISTEGWLTANGTSRPHPERFLSLHHHRITPPTRCAPGGHAA